MSIEVFNVHFASRERVLYTRGLLLGEYMRQIPCTVAKSNGFTRLEKRFSDCFTGMRIVCSRHYHCEQTSRLKHDLWTKVDSIEVCCVQAETAILDRGMGWYCVIARVSPVVSAKLFTGCRTMKSLTLRAHPTPAAFIGATEYDFGSTSYEFM